MAIMDIFRSINAWFAQKKNRALLKHFLLVCFLLVLIRVGMTIFLDMGVSTIVEWTEHYPSLFWGGDSARAEFAALEYSPDIDTIGIQQKERLREQFVEIRNRAVIHLKVMLYFYSRYIMATSMATVLGLIASIVFLLVSRVGWAKADKYLITILIVTASTAVFFGLAPQLYKQSENLEANKKLYVSYKALEERVLNYIATGHDLSTDNKIEKVDSKIFIHRIGTQLDSLHYFPIEIDADVIPEPGEILQDIIPQ